MKRIFPLLLMLLSFLSSKAQYEIPDSNFRKVLELKYPSLMVAGKLDTILAATYVTSNFGFSMDVSNRKITSLEGIKYFKRLDGLNCSDNQLTSLPELPDSLTGILLDNNFLRFLPELPKNFGNLRCNNNLLEELPLLPDGLGNLECRNNKLTNLPKLPASLKRLYVDNNFLDSLPTLPDSMQYLYCKNNKIKHIPKLPLTLELLGCENNQIAFFEDIKFPESLTNINCSNNQLSVLPTFGLNLEVIDCKQNKIIQLPPLNKQLNSLNCGGNLLTELPELPEGLGGLFCSKNQITFINKLPDTLIYFYCNNNKLVQLPQIGPFLEFLQCQNNYLTSLPNLPEYLNQLNCDSNQLTSLPTLPRYLSLLKCRSNKIKEIPYIRNNNTINNLDCSYNNIESLDTLPPELTFLSIGYNPLKTLPPLERPYWVDLSGLKLKSLPVLNEKLSTLKANDNYISILSKLPETLRSLEITNNPLYCIESIPSSISIVKIKNTFLSCLPNTLQPEVEIDVPLTVCSEEENCKNFSKVMGYVFHDENENNIMDKSEKRLNNILLKNTIFENINVSGNNGMYYLFLDTSQNNSWEVSSRAKDYYEFLPKQYELKPSAPGIISESYNFGMRLRPNIPDLKIALTTGPIRPGFEANATITSANVGTISQNDITVKLLYPNELGYLSAQPEPSAFNGDTIIWNNISMSLFEENRFIISFQVPATADLLGTPFSFESWIDSPKKDSTPENNYSKWIEIVRGSYDPNDKLVNTDKLLPDYSSEENILYTIRFQNTGTDTAFTVIVRDELPDYLDASTVTVVNSSHDLEFIARDKNILEFIFPNILLVDSATNEPKSHGFVQLEVKPIEGLVIDDSIKNNASIFFDYNEPIITPNALTVVKEISTGIASNKNLFFSIYPNPSKSNFTVALPYEANSAVWMLTDISGRTVKSGLVNNIGKTLEISVADVASGTYIFSLQMNGEVSSAKVVVVK